MPNQHPRNRTPYQIPPAPYDSQKPPPAYSIPQYLHRHMNLENDDPHVEIIVPESLQIQVAGYNQTTRPNIITSLFVTISSDSNPQKHSTTNYAILDLKRDITKRDREFFRSLNRIYYNIFRPSAQRYMSFRKLNSIAMYQNHQNQVILPWGEDSRRQFICAFKDPNGICTGRAWLDYICQVAEDQNYDLGLVFVEGWDIRKITILVGVLLMTSVLTAIIWIAVNGDVQTAMAVASYILTASGVVVAWLGLISALGS